MCWSSRVSLSDELGFICHLAFKQGFFFHVRKMAPSELLSYRHLFIRPLPGWIIQNMLKVVLLPDIWKSKAACSMSAYICLHKSDVILSKPSLATVGGAFSTWNINCSALCGSWCLHFWKSNCRIPCESSVLYGCSFLFPVCTHGTVENCFFIFIFNCMYLDVWGLSSFSLKRELSSCGTHGLSSCSLRA